MPWSVVIMVISIVLIGTVGKILKEHYRARGQAEPAIPPDLIASRDEVRQLKERVAVLERLVTDTHGSLGLDREIERLRTAPTPPPAPPRRADLAAPTTPSNTE